jgi:hypothetical protein
MGFEDYSEPFIEQDQKSETPENTIELRELAKQHLAVIDEIGENLRYRLGGVVVSFDDNFQPDSELTEVQQQELYTLQDRDDTITKHRWDLATELATSELERDILFLTIDYYRGSEPATQPKIIDDTEFRIYSIGHDSEAEYYAGYNPVTNESCIAFSMISDPEENIIWEPCTGPILPETITPFTRTELVLDIQRWRGQS